MRALEACLGDGLCGTQIDVGVSRIVVHMHLTGLHARYPEWVDPVNGTHHRYLCTYNLQQKSADMTLQGMQRAVELLGTFVCVCVCVWC